MKPARLALIPAAALGLAACASNPPPPPAFETPSAEETALRRIATGARHYIIRLGGVTTIVGSTD